MRTEIVVAAAVGSLLVWGIAQRDGPAQAAAPAPAAQQRQLPACPAAEEARAGQEATFWQGARIVASADQRRSRVAIACAGIDRMEQSILHEFRVALSCRGTAAGTSEIIASIGERKGMIAAARDQWQCP